VVKLFLRTIQHPRWAWKLLQVSQMHPFFFIFNYLLLKFTSKYKTKELIALLCMSYWVLSKTGRITWEYLRMSVHVTYRFDSVSCKTTGWFSYKYPSYNRSREQCTICKLDIKYAENFLFLYWQTLNSKLWLFLTGELSCPRRSPRCIFFMFKDIKKNNVYHK